MKNGIETLNAAVQKDTQGGENCFNATGCNQIHHVHEPQDNPRLVEMGVKTQCRRVVKCFHLYCDKYKWIIDRANHYAERLGVTQEQVLEAWETKRNYWYMNFYQDCNQPLLDDSEMYVYDNADSLKASFEGQGFRCPSCGGVSKDAYDCSCEGCDWKSYGLFTSGVVIVLKDTLNMGRIFKPVAWEPKEEVTSA